MRECETAARIGAGGVRVLAVGGLHRHGRARDGAAMRVNYRSFQRADARLRVRAKRKSQNRNDDQNGA